MANPTAGTLTALTKDGFTAFPAGDVFNVGSNSSPASLAYDVGGDTDGVIFIVTNQMETAINIVVGLAAGGTPPANQAGLGALASGNVAQNAQIILGPVESGRFIQNTAQGNAGKLLLTLTPASGTLAATVVCLQVPKP